MKKYFEHTDRKTSVWAALFSCLTLFSLLVYFAPGWYQELSSMQEMVCGQVIWKAYPKQADMTVVKTILFGLPVCYFFFTLLFGILRYENFFQKQEAVLIGGGYLTGLILILTQRQCADQFMISYGILLVGYVLCKRGKDAKSAKDLFLNNLYSAMLVYMGLLACLLLLSWKRAGVAMLWQQHSRSLLLVILAYILTMGILRKYALFCYEKILYVQFILPLGLMGMIHFRYVYGETGEMMELFYSRKWALFCILLLILLYGSCFRTLLVKKQKKLTWSTYVMVALFRIFMQPEGLMSIDFFHNGELTMPMQQMMSYNRLPYKGLVPIHGLCDYFYGGLSYLFFDGTYLSLNAAKIVGSLLMAIAVVTVVYFFVEGQLQSLVVVYFFLPYLMQQAGIRYLFLFIMFLVLFSKKMRDGFWFIYTWVLLSIFATAWNASIGGATALAFLPIVLYRAVFVLPGQIKEEMRQEKRFLWTKVTALLGLLVIGISYIPMFLQIVEYLLDNTATTLFVNGMEMFPKPQNAAGYLVPGLWGMDGDFFATAFGFMIPLLVCLSYFFQKGKGYVREYLVILLVCFLVLINYAFVRFDEGLRSAVMGMFFTLLIMITLLWKEKNVPVYILCLGFLFWIVDDPLWISSDSLSLVWEVPKSVETTIMGRTVDDPVVYVTGDSVGIPNLGSGFVQGNSLNSLCNVSKVLTACQSAGMSCLDLTNEIANQVVFDLDNYWEFTSAYNISNDRMQRKAISYMKEELPQVILVAPEIVFDDAPFALRSPVLYQFLMQQGYETYKYENVIYLTREENSIPQAQKDDRALAQLWHKKEIGYLPKIWGNSSHEQLTDVTNKLPDYKIVRTKEGFDLVWEAPVCGKNLSLLEMNLPVTKQEKSDGSRESDSLTDSEITLQWDSDLAIDDRESAYVFTADESGTYCLPIGLSPYFSMTESIEKVSFVFDTASFEWDESLIDVHAYVFRE